MIRNRGHYWQVKVYAGRDPRQRRGGRAGRQLAVAAPGLRDWVAAARERGYLSPARPGRRGAAPGPRLKGRAGGDDDGVR